MDRIEEKLNQMGYRLPSPTPGSKIEPAKAVGDLVFVSGHGNSNADGVRPYVGRVGAEVTLEEGYESARLCAVNALAGLKRVIGNLERVDEIVKVLGFVNSAPDFHQQPEVMHGFTDLMVELFGDKGRHARSAIGTNNLPKNQPVEVEMIVTIKD